MLCITKYNSKLNMFVHRESKTHLEAKTIVAAIYKSQGDDMNVFVEYPLMKYNYNKDNTWAPMLWSKQSQIPDYDQCKMRYGDCIFGPFKIVDIAVFNRYGRLICVIEIHHTSPVPADKINRIKQEGIQIYEVNASDVLKLETKDLNSLRTILKRL